jgi:chromosome segregation ATPase
LLSTRDTEIAQLRADLQTAANAATLKDHQITQLRADLTWVFNNAAARANEITKLHRQLQFTEQVLRQEIKKREDAKRLYTVHENTQHFSRLRVEELTKANEELEEEKAELQQWFDRERGARGELEELKKRLYELSMTPDV